jgi:hypothetical protein
LLKADHKQSLTANKTAGYCGPPFCIGVDDMQTTLKSLKALALIAFIVTAPLSAQDYYSPSSFDPMVMNMPNVWAEQAEREEAQTVRKPTAASPAPQNRAVTLSYAPSKQRTLENLKNFINTRRESNPVGAEQLEQLVASTDVIGMVQQVFSQFGLERNNVASAQTLYWISMWGLANKQHNAPSLQSVQAVAKQVENGLKNSAEFAAMSNSDKQALAEELMMLTALLDSTSEKAKSDPALAAQAAKASMEGSRKSGLDLDKMTLTENGFVAKPKKRADASEATEGEGETALASNAAGGGNDEGLSTSQLAMIAAAGGAGLAGVFLFGKAMGKKG